MLRKNIVLNGLGRPKFVYLVPSAAAKQVTAAALQNPHEAPVTLQSSRLRRLCRFEKGGYCKETKKRLLVSKLPPILKTRLDHLTPISGQASANLVKAELLVAIAGGIWCSRKDDPHT